MKKLKSYAVLCGLYYFLLSFLLLFIFFGSPIDISIFSVNVAAGLVYYFIIWFYINKKYGSQFELFSLVFIYGVVWVGIYNYLFYLHHGDYFAFSAEDSLEYHALSTHILENNLSDGFQALKMIYSIDDWGYPIYSTIFYRVIDSPLMVNFINTLINAITSVCIYRIGCNFMSKKSAYLSAIIYCLSSYCIFYQASGLKETLMVFLCVLSFYYYYLYLTKIQYKYILYTILVLVLLLFFRVPLILFFITTIFITEIFKSGMKIKRVVVVASVTMVAVILLNNYIELLVRYFIPFDVLKNIIERETDTSGYSPIITAIFSGFLGPFPTLLPIEGYENLSVFASGLIFKVFLSPFFIFGIVYAFKNKNKLLLPIALFTIIEILSLTYLLATFELRKSLPHFPFLIMMALYAFDSMQQKRYNMLIKNTMRLSSFALVLVVFFWNYLRFV